MSRPCHLRRRSLRLAAVLVAAGLVMSGCGSDSDPRSWEEAQEGEFAVRDNYLKACKAANDGERGFSEVEARLFCECSFDALYEPVRDTGLTFEEFKDLDDALRNNPDPDQLSGETWDVWRKYRGLVQNCESGT